MYVVHETFHAKPGKAKELVRRFKAAAPIFEANDEGKNFRIMTDVASNYWTVIMSYEVEDIGAFLGNLRTATGSPELQEIMKGYLDLIDGGKREIFLLE
jgi:hypothetical protein